MSDYNYTTFSSGNYDFDRATGPGPGEKAQDFLVWTSTGEPRHLLDFEGEFLVLEMGSLTCPLFQSRRQSMQRMAAALDTRASHAVLYVREAHPGARIPQHVTADGKRACARRLESEDGESRRVLVDDLAGTVHRAYGGMPNTVFIINRHGCVVFRAEWNNPVATRKALDALLHGGAFRARSYFRPGTPGISVRTLRRAGKGSASDFLRSFPALIWQNLVKRNLRLLFDRPRPLSSETLC